MGKTNYNKVSSKRVVKDDMILESEVFEEVSAPTNLVYSVNTPLLNVRTDPDLKAPIKGTLSKDTIITSMDDHDDWIEMHTNTGLEGYVMKEFLKEV